MTEPSSEKRHHPRTPMNSRFLLHFNEEEYMKPYWDYITDAAMSKTDKKNSSVVEVMSCTILHMYIMWLFCR